MTSSLPSFSSAIRITRNRLFRGLSVFAILSVFAGALLAQTDPAAPADANTNANGRVRRGQNGQNGGNANGNGGGRANFDPAQMQERRLTQLREQFGVTDDAEWKLVSDRITAG